MQTIQTPHPEGARVPFAQPPKFVFQWNGELRLLDLPDHEPAAGDAPSVHRGLRCCTDVIVKRIPASVVDGAALDFNIQLSAALQNEQRLQSGMVHLLQSLTCHTGRPGDNHVTGQRYYYLALESCEMNLARAIKQTADFAASLQRRASLDQFDEDRAPLLLWRARRSIARQLVSAVAFLHRTGLGPVRRIFHNNLKPANVLLKNGIVKLSEINHFSSTEAFVSVLDRSPAAAAAVAATGVLDDSPLHAEEPLPTAHPPPLPRPPPAIAEQQPIAPSSSSSSSAPSPAVDGASATALDGGGDCLQQDFVPRIPPQEQAEATALAARLLHARSAGPASPESAAAAAASPAAAPSQAPPPPPAAAAAALMRERLHALLAHRDRFALGCLVHHALTLGQHPFGSGAAAALASTGGGASHRGEALGRQPTISARLARAAAGAASAMERVSALLLLGRAAAAAAAAAAVTAATGVTAGDDSDGDVRVAAVAGHTAPAARGGGGAAAAGPSATAGPTGAAPAVLHVHSWPAAVASPHEPRASHLDDGDVARASLASSENGMLLRVAEGAAEGAPRRRRRRSAPWQRLPPPEAAAVDDGDPATSGAAAVPTAPPAPPAAPAAAVAAAAAAAAAVNPVHHKHHVTPLDAAPAADHEEAADLICGLIAPPDATAAATGTGAGAAGSVGRTTPSLSPAAALSHPFFWSAHRKFLFLQTVSESTVVGYAGPARGLHAAYCAAIQRAFCARLRPAHAQLLRESRRRVTVGEDESASAVGGGGEPEPAFADADIAWGPLFPPPPGLGPEGWRSPRWRQKRPEEYEAGYAPKAGMYALARFCRNLYVHGPDHVRAGIFASLPALQAFVLGTWPWLIVELWRIDAALGGAYARYTLAGGEGGEGGGGDSSGSDGEAEPPQGGDEAGGGADHAVTAADVGGGGGGPDAEAVNEEAEEGGDSGFGGAPRASYGGGSGEGEAEEADGCGDEDVPSRRRRSSTGDGPMGSSPAPFLSHKDRRAYHRSRADGAGEGGLSAGAAGAGAAGRAARPTARRRDSVSPDAAPPSHGGGGRPPSQPRPHGTMHAVPATGGYPGPAYVAPGGAEPR